LAYFEPTDYDYDILEKARLVNTVSPWLRQVFDSKLDFYSIVKILLDLSLLDKTSSSGSYSMHRVVYDWLCTYIAHETDDELLNLAASAIAWSCPNTYTPLVWAEEQQRLILHANILYPRLKNASFKVLPVYYDLLKEADLQRAAELWECNTDSLKMSRVYQPIGDIARLLSAGNRPREALTLIEDSIKYTTESTTEHDELYFTLLYEKCSLLSDMSDFDGAERLMAETMTGFQQLHNPYWIISTRIMQGCLLGAQNHVEAGIELFHLALRDSRSAGLSIFSNPAWLAFDNIDKDLQWTIGDSNRRKAHLEAVKSEAEAIGYNNNNAQSALIALANVYAECGNVVEAENLYLKILHWQVSRDGRDALETGWRCHDLGIFYFNQSRPESIEYDTEWLRVCTIHHGAEGKETGMAHYWVAESYERHRRYGAAQDHFEKALNINRKLAGLEASERLILNGLIRVSRAQGNIEAVERYEKIRYPHKHRDANPLEDGQSITLDIASLNTWSSQSGTLVSDPG
jgi:tetratricopeptide (TPR) repeat protein